MGIPLWLRRGGEAQGDGGRTPFRASPGPWEDLRDGEGLPSRAPFRNRVLFFDSRILSLGHRFELIALVIFFFVELFLLSCSFLLTEVRLVLRAVSRHISGVIHFRHS